MFFGKYVRKFPMNPGSPTPNCSSSGDLQLVEKVDGLNSFTLQAGKHRIIPIF